MKPAKRTAAALTALSVLFLAAALTACDGAAGPDAGGGGNDAVLTESQRILELTNEYRAENGLAPLAHDAKLQQAAQEYAEAMADRNFFSHNGLDGSSPGSRISDTGYDWATYGENIAYGYSTPEQTMDGWIGSSGHRANILGKGYKELGVGYAVRGSTAYWVQDFGAR